MHNFNVFGCDTDSIIFCKADQTPFTEEEQKHLLNEINSKLPSRIKFEHDGIFSSVIYLKAKNYILFDGKKIKQKGSSLKSSTLEPRLKDFLEDMIKVMLDGNNNYQEIYYKYVREINNITDIKPWASKKTLSEKTYNSDRANETKILDAIKEKEYTEGDRVYLYVKEDNTLGLVEDFDGKYNKDKYWEKLYKCTERFETVLPIDDLFPNFKLKKNKLLLKDILNPKVGVLTDE